jgi:hypothetical protein
MGPELVMTMPAATWVLSAMTWAAVAYYAHRHARRERRVAVVRAYQAGYMAARGRV